MPGLMVVPKTFRNVGRLRPFISRVLQANLLNHWFDMDLAQHRRRGVRYFKENGDSTYRAKLERIQNDLYSDVKPIPLKAIKVALVALAVGFAAALGLFMCEFVGDNVERICGTITGHVFLHAIMGF